MTDINKKFKDFFGMPVSIYADDDSWSVLWADYSSDHEERKDTAENNFKMAKKFAESLVGELMEDKPSIFESYTFARLTKNKLNSGGKK